MANLIASEFTSGTGPMWYYSMDASEQTSLVQEFMPRYMATPTAIVAARQYQAATSKPTLEAAPTRASATPAPSVGCGWQDECKASERKTLAIALGSALPVVVAIIAVFLFLWIAKRRKRKYGQSWYWFNRKHNAEPLDRSRAVRRWPDRGRWSDASLKAKTEHAEIPAQPPMELPDMAALLGSEALETKPSNRSISRSPGPQDRGGV